MTDSQFKKIQELKYDKPEIKKGYANQTLYVNLSDSAVKVKPVSRQIKEVFTGGKGFDLWLLWNAVTKNTKWNDPENEICIGAGPMCGTPIFPGSGKSIVTTISPLTGMVIDSNVGGYFGPYMKFSGFDALEIQGKSSKEVVVFIDGIEGKIILFETYGLPDDSYELSEVLTKKFGEDNPRQVSIVSTGQGSKNTLIGCLNFSWYDLGRKRVRYKQAGRGGIGSVFADKGIKAVVAKFEKISVELNGPADIALLKETGKKYSSEMVKLDPKQNRMSVVGTTHLVSIMDAHDLLPTNNFRYGQHKDSKNLDQEAFIKLFDKGFDGCWMGCPVACAHGVKDFVPKTGPYKGKKVFVDGPEYETIAGCGSNIGIFDAHTVVEMNFYCDAYGIDTISVGTGMAFVMECFETGLINKTHTEGMDLSFGNRTEALELVHQMARGEGFGKIVGTGIRNMKKLFAEKFGSDPKIMQDIGMESKGLEFSEYMTKESLAQQGGYGLALKGPQHDEAWLIFLDMVHNFMPSFEQKAEALHWFPMFRTWFGLCGLCKLPWNDIVPEDNSETQEPAKVIKHVQWYADYFKAVTGRVVKPEDLITMSEKVYNFQRIFNLKMGFGRREHDSLPFRAMGPVTIDEYESRKDRYDKQLIEKYKIDIKDKDTSEKLAVLRNFREQEYEKLKDAVYKRRGWTNNGIPTLETVKQLKIDFPEVVELISVNQ